MFKPLILFFLLLLLFSGCSKNAIFPTDTKVYDSPENYTYSYEEFYFKSSQEAMLRGWLFRAKGPSQGMIVVANGMIFNMSSRFTEWTWVLEKGYDLFIFDYRGYGESMGEVDMFGFVDDVTSAIEYAHSLDMALPMVVVGQSMGGSFVIDAVAKKSYPYVKLLVIDSTMTGFAAAGEELAKQHVLLWPLVWVLALVTLEGVDSIDFVDQTATPTLFTVGLSDTIIPPSHSAELFVKANEPKALWIVEAAEHVKCIDNEVLKNDLAVVLDGAMKGECNFELDIRYYESNVTILSEHNE